MGARTVKSNVYIMKSKKKVKKKRAATYEKPLKLYGTFGEVLKALVQERPPVRK